jgi:hypothetical protein
MILRSLKKFNNLMKKNLAATQDFAVLQIKTKYKKKMLKIVPRTKKKKKQKLIILKTDIIGKKKR